MALIVAIEGLKTKKRNSARNYKALSIGALVTFSFDCLTLLMLRALNLYRAIDEFNALSKTAVVTSLSVRNLIEDTQPLAALLRVVAQQVDVVRVRQVGDVA